MAYRAYPFEQLKLQWNSFLVSVLNHESLLFVKVFYIMASFDKSEIA